LGALTTSFGKVGEHFYHIVRGSDDRPVEPNRPHKSISAETTFDADLTEAEELVTTLGPLAAQVAARLGNAALQARVVILKVKYADFRLLTRRRTLPHPVADAGAIRDEAQRLLRGLELEAGVRLLGVGVEGLFGVNEGVVTQPSLFSR